MTSPHTDLLPGTTAAQDAGTEPQCPAGNNQEQILQERARQLAHRHETDGWEETRQVVCFHLAGERYVLPLDNLARIEPLHDWTPVPGAPAELLGVMELYGQITPLLDLAVVLDTDHTTRGGGTGLYLHRACAYAGYRVDGIEQIQAIKASALESRAAGGLLTENRYISGRLDDGALLLRPESLLNHPVFKGESV